MKMKIKVSVVIPNYNGRKLLETNLPKVIAACQAWGKSLSANRQSWEIIVVDDASTDNSVEFLKIDFPEVKIVKHRHNQRFAASCNKGLKEAGGKVVVFLNTDVIPEEDFLKPLVSHFQDQKVFAVGCREKDIRNGKIYYSGRAEAKFKRGFLVHRRANDQNQSETFWATAGSMAVDREKYLKLGGMDTLFRPAYYEDIDLCWRARQKGYQILFEPKSQVFHHHETTNLSVFSHQQMKVFAYKNQFLFIWKNGNLGWLIAHLVWLPYHFAKAISNGDWLFVKGFGLALKQLPELIKK